jgi:voltage-gated potassium channel
MNGSRIATLVMLLALVILGGMVFFRVVEGWSWIDSYFFTVVTLSTVGYGNLVPQTEIGKIGTTIFIFLGLGIFALVIQQIGSLAVIRREARRQARRVAKKQIAAEIKEVESEIISELQDEERSQSDRAP